MKPRLLDPLGETKVGLKSRIVEKSGLQLQRSTKKRGTTIGKKKNRGFEKQGHNCLGGPGGGVHSGSENPQPGLSQDKFIIFRIDWFVLIDSDFVLTIDSRIQLTDSFFNCPFIVAKSNYFRLQQPQNNAILRWHGPG